MRFWPFGKTEQRSLENPQVPLSDAAAINELFGDYGQSVPGVPITVETSLGLSAVWRAVNLISDHIGYLPVHVYRKEDSYRYQEDTHPVSLLLRKPNKVMTSFVFKKMMMACVLLWGNSYARIVRGSTFRPTELVIYHPTDVEPVIVNGEKFFYVAKEGKTYSDYDMIHLIGLSFDGIKGKSVIATHRENLALAKAAQKFGADFFGNGTNVGGFLEHPGSLGDKAYERLRTDFDSKYRGMSKSFGVPILEEGMKFTRIGIPPEDAQFIQTRQFSKSEIANMFGVPAHKVNDLDKASFSNIEQQSLDYVMDGLTGWVVRFEEELNYKLFRTDEFAVFYCKFNMSALFRGDMAARQAYYTAMISIGGLNQDEVRAMEDKNPLPDKLGQQYYRLANLVPINSATINQTLNGIDKNTQQK